MLNITSLPWKLFSLRKWLFHILFLLSITSLFYATDPGQNFRNAFGSLCKSSLSILAIGAIVLIVLAAIAAIIFVVVPWLISIIMTGQASGDWVKNCCVDNPEPDCAGLGNVESSE
ncbi:hypothetical protein J4450_07290 [Candidatus Micrarchaeota archaeon]|nr:hypothetical protein [Candidatus Micrarchaeota archaeon]